MTQAAEPDFEVIVIGAGIAGCVAAYQLARQGRSVLLIERGEAPGSKNLSGGVLYSRGIQQVFPDFRDEAPVERRITRNYINFLNADSSVAIDYKDARLADPVNAVTVLRAKLDVWLSEKCEEAGAMIMPGVRVDRVLTEGTRVVGVQASDDELRAHVVVAADGVNSLIAKETGLRQKEPLNHLAVGVKSVISLPRETMTALRPDRDEGAALAVVAIYRRGRRRLPVHQPGLAVRRRRACASMTSPPGEGRHRRLRPLPAAPVHRSLPRGRRAARATAAAWWPRRPAHGRRDRHRRHGRGRRRRRPDPRRRPDRARYGPRPSAPPSPPPRPSAMRWTRRTPPRRSLTRCRDKLFASPTSTRDI